MATIPAHQMIADEADETTITPPRRSSALLGHIARRDREPDPALNGMKPWPAVV